MSEYNRRFTKTLEAIKRRHDPTVTTVAQGVLEWKRSFNARNINLDVQQWLDRFYLSRIGIRFLIGQRAYLHFSPFARSFGPLRHRSEYASAAPGLCRHYLHALGTLPVIFLQLHVFIHSRP